jgi:bifunctional DNA-binding transcriptional regulator/antitoxin component of YhaV-PrlF toxin-antitoxin module
MPKIQDPQDVTIRDDGTVVPISLLAQAGLNAGEKMMAASTDDERIFLRRLTDAIDDLLSGRPL